MPSLRVVVVLTIRSKLLIMKDVFSPPGKISLPLNFVLRYLRLSKARNLNRRTSIMHKQRLRGGTTWFGNKRKDSP